MTASSATPRAQGYSMPAEWEPHEATWISWPRREGQSFPDSYERVLPTLVSMASAIAESEILRINISGREQEREVRALLAPSAPMERVEFHDIPTNEPWCRDHGPIFVRREASPRIAVNDFGYNAWGGKYPPFEADDVVPTTIARRFGLPLFEPGFILEGGSVDPNGAGTLLTTESCLLNPNRNPSMTRGQIEGGLRDYLGVEQILWLGDGIEGDDTDGHVDDITRFVSQDTVVTVVEHDSADPNHAPLRANLELLRSMTLADGTPLKVVEMPMPPRIDREGLRLPASHANFYITNTSVLLPAFGGNSDDVAVSILTDLFQGRSILPIDCRELIWGLGAFHCLTQQQPAVR
ncbi:MAG: agmatine deiminase family protein [Chthoniobacterales bacterium]